MWALFGTVFVTVLAWSFEHACPHAPTRLLELDDRLSYRSERDPQLCLVTVTHVPTEDERRVSWQEARCCAERKDYCWERNFGRTRILQSLSRRAGPEVILRAFHRHLGNKSGREMEKGQMKTLVTEG